MTITAERQNTDGRNVLKWAVFTSVYGVLAAFLVAFSISPAHTMPAPTFMPVPSAVLSVQGSGVPVRVLLPRLGIDAPVQPGAYDALQKTWNVSDTAAQFASVTVTPNTIAGKTLIYAHNTKNLFGPTARVKPGDTALVVTDRGSVFTYVYTGENVVRPTDTEIFNQVEGGLPQLVLLTCRGAWNQERRLLRFQFVGVSI